MKKIIIAFLMCFTLTHLNALTLNIPSYPVESIIPDDYTFNSGGNCSGANVSPQLIWSDVPEGTQSFAVIFEDLNFNWIHWKLFNIDPNVTHLPENNPLNSGTDGTNSFGLVGYDGPCPPSPNPGNYVMTVYALDTDFQSQPSVGAIRAAEIESASWLAYRDINDSQERYEYMATYRLTFHAEWSVQSHPTAFPNGAHFSPLIGNTHNNEGYIWRDNTLASPGIEAMAETGSTTTLRSEITTSINNSGSESQELGAGIGATDTTQLEFVVSESHPLFSMVTMIAPSPDWFVGVHDLDLRENGVFRDNFIVDLYPYDSGTDSGMDFTSGNMDTDPQVPIFRIMNAPFNNVPLGRFEFELLSTVGAPPDDIFAHGFEQ